MASRTHFDGIFVASRVTVNMKINTEHDRSKKHLRDGVLPGFTV
jgi:hypothetical protein